jgi:hypothetical protein
MSFITSIRKDSAIDSKRLPHAPIMRHRVFSMVEVIPRLETKSGIS